MTNPDTPTNWLNLAIVRGDSAQHWRDNADRWQKNYEHSGRTYWFLMVQDAKIVIEFLERIGR